MPGVQTLVPLMLDQVNAGALSLQRFADLTSAGPARVYGIAGKGRIALGYDADLTLVDMKARRTITKDWSASRCGWTPYDGWTVTGWPMATIVRGRDRHAGWGAIVAAAGGQPVRFLETLAPATPASPDAGERFNARRSRRNARCRHARCRSGNDRIGPRPASPSAAPA